MAQISNEREEMGPRFFSVAREGKGKYCGGRVRLKGIGG